MNFGASAFLVSFPVLSAALNDSHKMEPVVIVVVIVAVVVVIIVVIDVVIIVMIVF